MERSYGTYIPPQNIGGGKIGPTQAGIGEMAASTPRYLQKKRSNNVLSTNAPPRTVPTDAPYSEDRRSSAGLGEAPKARKGSLRHAVRRIFGRRSREEATPQSQITPPRPVYNQNATLPLSAMEELSPVRTRGDASVQRTRSTPITNVPTSDAQRTRSPYAMQFPHSARLKPLELGNPFAPAGSQLRRRKTLPTVQTVDPDVNTLSTYDESPDRHLASRDSFMLSSSKRDKRRSRSAGDLRGSLRQQPVSPRKQNEDMRQWRESFQGSVLRASGFTTKSSSRPNMPDDDDDGDDGDDNRTPIPTIADPFESARLKVTPALQRDPSTRDLGSGSAVDTELSRDIEDRVARLEAGLQSFRGQLQQLSGHRNRKTVLIGGVPAPQRAPSAGRTASILATDLQKDLGPSNYRYQFRESTRTSTSPPPPRTPTRTDPSTVTPQLTIDASTADDPFVSPSRALPGSAGVKTRANRNIPPEYTFRSLYEMLADERSARRRLETKLNSLQDQITSLHHQMSTQSNVQSQRSSYYAPMEAGAGSSRLHELLRDTETTPPSASRSQGQQRFSGDEPGLMSRFSGSESEMGGALDADELLQTPHEEGRFPFSSRQHEGAMF